MEPELAGLDWNADPVDCCIQRCGGVAKFIVRFQPHPHTQSRWYPVCLSHVKADSTCERCPGKRFPREAIETL